MKAIVILALLSVTLVSSPAVLPKRVVAPTPKFVHITKKTGKFLKFM